MIPVYKVIKNNGNQIRLIEGHYLFLYKHTFVYFGSNDPIVTATKLYNKIDLDNENSFKWDFKNEAIFDDWIKSLGVTSHLIVDTCLSTEDLNKSTLREIGFINLNPLPNEINILSFV